jgi:Zn-dependent protease/CBS domain-containing protein
VRVFGVRVRVDTSWYVIAAIVAWIYLGAASGAAGAPSGPLLWLGAALAVGAFFISLLAHELGHALANRAFGVPVIGITLFMLGGVTESAREARRPSEELIVVGAGPLASLTVAAFATALGFLRPPEPFATLLWFLIWGNVLLAGFNLIPGYPLDGGRLLRALLWGASGRPHAATRWAARIGQAFAALVALYGGRLLLSGPGGFDGLWEIMLGFFLFRGAAQAHAAAGRLERLAERTAGDVMGSAPPALDPGATLAEALEQVQERPSLLWPVGEPLVGALTLDQIDAVADVDWHHTTVGAVALPLEGIVVEASLSLADALDVMRGAPGGMVLVTRDGALAGLLTPSLLGDAAA